MIYFSNMYDQSKWPRNFLFWHEIGSNSVALSGFYFYWSLLPTACYQVRIIVYAVSSMFSFSYHREEESLSRKVSVIHKSHTIGTQLPEGNDEKSSGLDLLTWGKTTGISRPLDLFRQAYDAAYDADCRFCQSSCRYPCLHKRRLRTLWQFPNLSRGVIL